MGRGWFEVWVRRQGLFQQWLRVDRGKKMGTHQESVGR